jgi:hypothetical protein
LQRKHISTEKTEKKSEKTNKIISYIFEGYRKLKNKSDIKIEHSAFVQLNKLPKEVVVIVTQKGRFFYVFKEFKHGKQMYKCQLHRHNCNSILFLDKEKKNVTIFKHF